MQTLSTNKQVVLIDVAIDRLGQQTMPSGNVSSASEDFSAPREMTVSAFKELTL